MAFVVFVVVSRAFFYGHILRPQKNVKEGGLHGKQRRVLNISEDIFDEFCHSDPGINAQTYSRSSKHNCFGYCDDKLERVQVAPSAIVAPVITRLCLENPFHGFYDCIWPLLHYMTACTAQPVNRETIIVDLVNLSEIRKTRWVAQAQQAFLRYVGREFNVIDRWKLPKCTCFNHVVKFKRNTMWRPVRFQSQQKVGDAEVLTPHPTALKRKGLQTFRDSVLAGFGLDSDPASETAPVIVYGREDATRRRWLNVDQFEELLKECLPANTRVMRWNVTRNRGDDDFEMQVRQMNSARLVVAPHGAGMSNTLFSRRKTAIIEIASRRCGTNQTAIDLREAMNVNDENTWTPWHAESLDLVHIAAPCWYEHNAGEEDFHTDNKQLVQLTLEALHLQQKL